MPATAKLELAQTKLIVQQSSDCVASITNTGKVILSDVNPRTNQAFPILEVKNLATGAIDRFSSWRDPGEEPYEFTLTPGKSKKTEFFLSDVLEFPGPGKYEIRARYEWNNGTEAAVSEPTIVDVAPATPALLHTATAQGGVGGLYFAAWLNKPDATGKKMAVWLSSIATTTKPTVTHSVRLANVERPVAPVVSVPPDSAPFAQWIAWVDEELMHFVMSQGEDVKGPESLDFHEAGWRIIPPLFQNMPVRGESFPRGDVLLYHEVEGEPGFHLRIAHLLEGGKSKLEDPFPIKELVFKWAESAFLSTGERLTFLVALDKGKPVLYRLDWSITKSPAPPKKLLELPGRFVAADLRLTDGDAVVGAILVEMGEAAGRNYSFVRWANATQDRFEERDATEIKTPGGFGVAQAVVAVNKNGSPFAQLKGDAKQPIWYFVDNEGVALPMAGPGEKFKLPADILFRRGIEPVVLFSEPGQGFILVKPR